MRKETKMRWHLALAIGLLSLIILQGSATIDTDLCSSITYNLSSDRNTISFLVKDTTTTMTRNCSCEVTTNSAINVCLVYTCWQCQADNYQCLLVHCFCSGVDLTISPACTGSSDWRSNFTLTLLMKSSIPCSSRKNPGNIRFTIKPLGTAGPVFKDVRCTPVSIYTSSTTVPPNESGKAIGIGVGVGGGILLLIVIVIVIFILRKRRTKSNKHHANNTSEGTVAAPVETALTSDVNSSDSPAYDNATSDTTPSYQTIAYDAEPVGEATNEYTEVQEPEIISNPNSYDNISREIGRNQAYSTSNGMGKNYDVSENPQTNIGNETTVIDNEFYG